MIDSLELALVQWDDYEAQRETCQTWIRETDAKLHAIDLKANLAEKQQQLAQLKVGTDSKRTISLIS